MAAVFAGDDESGGRYVMASKEVDLRGAVKAMNGALRGRGGGSAAMVQGSVTASRREIETYFGGTCHAS
jgi:alanyl-tRNA synthetase